MPRIPDHVRDMWVARGIDPQLFEDIENYVNVPMPRRERGPLLLPDNAIEHLRNLGISEETIARVQENAITGEYSGLEPSYLKVRRLQAERVEKKRAQGRERQARFRSGGEIPPPVPPALPEETREELRRRQAKERQARMRERRRSGQ